ncbi:MAG: polysaccharide deacetylase family protein [Myxococcota bacterium]
MSGFVRQWRSAVHAPKSWRGHLRQAVRGVVLSGLALGASWPTEPFLRCLYCHYVFDDQEAMFRRQVEMLCEAGTVVDTATLLAMRAGEIPITGPTFHLSFDDGFLNHQSNAARILKEYQVPALFFVPTGFIGADLETARRYAVDIADYQAPIEMMSWDDVASLVDSGFDVGSHTRHHARLSHVHDDGVLRDEIAGSKHDLETRLGRPCPTISWPFGTLDDISGRALECVEEAGYEACFGAYRGTVIPGKTDVMRIPRHHFEVQWPVGHVRYFAQGNREHADV